jgi:DNA-damage-inducible protein J
MANTAMIRARTSHTLKKEVDQIFQELGLNASQAINLFYHQVKLHHGLPFPVSIPNPTTIKAFEDTDSGKNIVRSESIDKAFEKLGI